MNRKAKNPADPYGVEAGRPILSERAVLGACLIEPDAARSVRHRISAAAFFLSQHQDVWAAMAAVMDRGAPLDAPTLCDELRRRGTLNRIGGPAFLDTLLDSTPTLLHFEEHVHRILDDHAVRTAVVCGMHATHIAKEGASPSEVGAAYRRASEACISTRFDLAPGDGLRSVLDGTSAEGVDVSMYGRPAVAEEDLGTMLGQIRMGQVMVVGAEPSAGKTAFGVSMSMALDHDGVPTAYVSTEETAEEIECRKASILSWVPYRKILSRDMTADDRSDVEAAYEKIRLSRARVWHCPGAEERDILAAVSRAILRDGARVVFLDYLQDVGTVRGGGRESDNERIGRFMRALAVTLGTSACAVVMSQLSRDTAGTKKQGAQLSRLRGSGMIEIKGRKVLFLDTGKREERGPRGGLYRREIGFNLAKNNNGPTGVMRGWLYLPYSLCWPGEIRPEWASQKRGDVPEEPWQRPMYEQQDDDDSPW